jgi:hypothetical protein
VLLVLSANVLDRKTPGLLAVLSRWGPCLTRMRLSCHMVQDESFVDEANFCYRG